MQAVLVVEKAYLEAFRVFVRLIAKEMFRMSVIASEGIICVAGAVAMLATILACHFHYYSYCYVLRPNVRKVRLARHTQL